MLRCFNIRRVDELAGLPRQVVVAVVDLVGCVRVPPRGVDSLVLQGALAGFLSENWRAFGDFSPGRRLWLLENVRRLNHPVKCRGFQGMWTLPAETASMVKSEMMK